MKKEFKVGDRVYSPLFGYGNVFEVLSCRIVVIFDNHYRCAFTESGYHNSSKLPVLFHEKDYKPLFQREVLVRNYPANDWVKRVLIKDTGKDWDYRYVTWRTSSSVEKAESAILTETWRYMKEIEEPTLTELSIEELEEKLNLSQGTLRIKK